jgi:hypothetical protein
MSIDGVKRLTDCSCKAKLFSHQRMMNRKEPVINKPTLFIHVFTDWYITSRAQSPANCSFRYPQNAQKVQTRVVNNSDDLNEGMLGDLHSGIDYIE